MEERGKIKEYHGYGEKAKSAGSCDRCHDDHWGVPGDLWGVDGRTPCPDCDPAGGMVNDSVIKTLCSIWGIHIERTLVFTVIVGLAAVFIIKGFFLFTEYQMQFKFVHDNKLAAQRCLLQTYLDRSYEYFWGTDFSKI